MLRIDIFCHQEVFPINRLLRQHSSANLNLSKTTEKEGIYTEKNYSAELAQQMIFCPDSRKFVGPFFSKFCWLDFGPTAKFGPTECPKWPDRIFFGMAASISAIHREKKPRFFIDEFTDIVPNGEVTDTYRVLDMYRWLLLNNPYLWLHRYPISVKSQTQIRLFRSLFSLCRVSR